MRCFLEALLLTPWYLVGFVLLVLMSSRPKGLLRSRKKCPQPAVSRFAPLHLAWFLVGGGVLAVLVSLFPWRHTSQPAEKSSIEGVEFPSLPDCPRCSTPSIKDELEKFGMCLQCKVGRSDAVPRSCVVANTMQLMFDALPACTWLTINQRGLSR